MKPSVWPLIGKIVGIWLLLNVGLFATQLFPVLLFGRVLFPLLGLWGVGVVVIRWRRARARLIWA